MVQVGYLPVVCVNVPSLGFMPNASSTGSCGGWDLHKAVVMLQGLYKFHQYQVVGRHLPTPNDETPQIYRMKLWATDAVRAKSKFWCV